MVRKMKCPYCGTLIDVSSHWDSTICPKCHETIEIGADIFKLSEEEQKKENEDAMKRIREEEAVREARIKETKSRMRALFHLPPEDPYSDIKFEDEEQESDASAGSKSVIPNAIGILAIAVGAFVIIVCILIWIMFSARMASSDSTQISATGASIQTVAVSNKPTVEASDGKWQDGYTIDSNSQDGKKMIDYQSEPGKQRNILVTVKKNDSTAASVSNSSSTSSTSNAQVEVLGNGDGFNNLLSSGKQSSDK